MVRHLWLVAMCLGAWVMGCTPALDWRSVRAADGGVGLQFPCKPTSRTRSVALGAASLPMTLMSCTAQGLTFGLAHAELDDPARVTPALVAMRLALVANLGAREVKAGPFTVAGATPNEHAVRVRFVGRSPDGAPIEEEAVFFARGMRVYQAAVLGARLDAQVVDVFFGSLRLDA